MIVIVWILVAGALHGCAAEPLPSEAPLPPSPVSASVDSTRWEAYPWLPAELSQLTPLSAVYGPPEGFERVAVAPGSFDAWLRQLPVNPLSPDGTARVEAYDGRVLRRPADRVIPLDVGTRNLQQCADSAIRLHAEYMRSSGQDADVGYHFTSGDLSTWGDWLAGERFAIAGSSVGRSQGPRREASPSVWRSWLELIFNYAGTRSLALDTEAVPVQAPIRGGDVFVHPGSPGHAVVVLDVAVDAGGQRVALVGQGFMPAQDFHVLRDSGGHVKDRVWFGLPGEGEVLSTPWGVFSRGQARRFQGVDGVAAGSNHIGRTAAHDE